MVGKEVEHAFRQRLSLGISTLVSVLPRVAEIPFHPVQSQMLKLILVGISSSPGVVSTKLVEAISGSLKIMLEIWVYTPRNAPYASEEIDLVCEQWDKFFTNKYLLLA
ncbi:protein PUTATIVE RECOMBINATION INITIATION DEFECT 1-like isoform X2 [Spinacia oleracea]|uniref:Protein PUTATIVE RECOMBINATION INITIATION DEFECT 1-like isoform X2 n=1 Tax=Spinacia oleracea TaxID=3562 RepID=A0ABM3QIZ2_SPIOL|nr:protein PUTATIVE RECOMBINATION INITIATION DEFECT 1-like isoform X2 [Spinacia oleracea]XP_056683337.1 protein PUTATIVE RECOMBINATION INITIATION DEFECT 1-like isoform X2 [Spinacia oleracea]